VAVGTFDSLAAAVSTVTFATQVRPDPALKARYDEMFALYQDAYRHTADIAHRLAAVESAS
jgi:sugar (pentulose or hexulose) kinase